MSDRRNSNIELLRIISMLMIIAGHFAGQGGLQETTMGIQRVIIFVLGSGQRLSINIFLIISVWFLVDQEFNPKRLIKVWLEVFFYTVIITVAVKVFGGEVGTKELIQAFIPFLGRPLWFASAYLALLMLSPFLKKLIELPKQQQRCLVVVLGLITCVLPTVASEMDTYLCAIIWFCFIYIAIGYYKHYIHPIKINGSICMIVGVMLYTGMAAFSGMQLESGQLHAVQIISGRFLHDFKSIPNILVAFCIFEGFVKVRPRYSTLINELAAGAFAVYIIHQTPVLYPLLWKILINTGLFAGNTTWIVFVGSVCLIYLLFSILDIIRRKIIEPPIINCRFVENIVDAIHFFYHNT